MKTMISLAALIALTLSANAYAAGMSGGGGLSGTAAGRGGFVSKSGFVKERNNEDDHMTGVESPKNSPDKNASEDAADGDIPAGDKADAPEETGHK